MTFVELKEFHNHMMALNNMSHLGAVHQSCEVSISLMMLVALTPTIIKSI